MTLWTFNPAILSLSNGTDLNTGHAAPQAWSSFHKNGTGRIDWESGEAHYESLAGANEYAQSRRTGLNVGQVSVEAAFTGSAAPSVESRVLEVRSGAATGRAAFVNVGTDNRLRLYNSTSALLHHFTTVLPTTSAGSWRLYLGVDPGTTASNGKIHARLYSSATGTTAAETWENNDRDAGTANVTEVRVGWVTNAVQLLRLRNIQVEDAAPIGPIGPITSTTVPPVVTLGPDVTVEAGSTVNLTATHTGGDAPDAWTWVQLSGESVALTGSGASRSFTAPATYHGAAVAIGVTPSKTGTAGAQDAITVNVLPQPMWARLPGATTWNPAGILQNLAAMALFGLTASATAGLYDLTAGDDVRQYTTVTSDTGYAPAGTGLTESGTYPGLYEGI